MTLFEGIQLLSSHVEGGVHQNANVFEKGEGGRFISM